MHYPARESLREYANRLNVTIEYAYPRWHNRSYPAVTVEYHVDGYVEPLIKEEPAMGPGLCCCPVTGHMCGKPNVKSGVGGVSLK